MLEIVSVLLAFSLPLSAIWSYTYLRSKRLSLRAAGHLEGGDRKAFQHLMEENLELKSRVENLELIVNDAGLLGSNGDTYASDKHNVNHDLYD